MEVSQWGLVAISRISDRYKELSRFLTEALAGDSDVVGSGSLSAGGILFESREPASLRLPVNSRGGERERLEAAFEALTPVFQAGFLLTARKSQNNQFSLAQMFLLGRKFSASARTQPVVQIGFPDLSSGKVVRGKTSQVLEALVPGGLEVLNGSSIFAFSPKFAGGGNAEPAAVILLVCDRPNPWQVSAVETAVVEIQKFLHAKTGGA